MATFALIPGAGSTSWHWHRVVPLLERAGHDVVAVDLPVDDDGAGFAEYADTAIDQIGDASDLVVVGQSMGAFTAALVCERLPARLLVLVAPMIPQVGESGGEWWGNTGHDEARRAHAAANGLGLSEDPVEMFLHDVPPDVAMASADHVREQSSTPFAQPFPLRAWPAVPTRVLIGRNDRFFPAEFQRRVTEERLGITPDELDSGHLPALANPEELADRLLGYVAEPTP